ncbi:MAG: efflux RND transporter periplasmic adaptor subunit [Wenzhouxiangellaceae bacterium]|nr:efflux RND transporter periplasmic adaptor subunit [Wenzhouxiangellaceae bacterium]
MNYRIAVSLLPVLLIGSLGLAASAPTANAQDAAESSAPSAISALGRLEPENGIIRVAAPAMVGITAGPAIRELLVAEGEDVVEGQLLAVTDLSELMKSIVAEKRAALSLARLRAQAVDRMAESDCALVETRLEEAKRRAQWQETNVSTREEYEQARAEAISVQAACNAGRADAIAAESAIEVSEAALRRAEAELARTEIRAPSAGRVLEILSWPGEAVSSQGALELGNVARMYAVAEVYETDVGRIRVGQPATVSSPALATPLTGVVEHVRLKIQKQDEIGTDPAARKDARIVEVEVLLDDPEPVQGLSNLQVTVLIGS